MNQKFFVRRGVVLKLTTAAVALASSNAAWAQSQPSDGNTEIVVTAERRDTSLQKTPVAVTAFTGDALIASGVKDTVALAQQTPSLQITPSGGGSPVSMQVALRGQVQNGINITNDPSVALYIDNVYIGKDAGNVTDVVDVGQIEVLKGPQGTLFGRNSTGGAIRYASNKPEFDGVSGSLRLGYGSFNNTLAQGVLNVPLGANVAIRYAGSYMQHDGYTKTTYANVGATGVVPVRTVGTDNLKSQLHRLSIRLRSGDLDWNVSGTYHNRQVDGYLGRNIAGDRAFLPSPLGPISAAAAANFYASESNATDLFGNPVDPVAYTKGYLLVSNLTLNLNDNLVLKMITGYGHNKTENNDFDVDGTVLPLVHVDTFQDFKQFSNELQLGGTGIDGKLNYVVGLYYFRERGDDQTDSQSAFGGRSHNLNLGVGTNRSLSAFAHFKYVIGESTTIQAGGRYTEDEKDLVVSSRQGPATSLTDPLPCVYPAGSANVDIATCTFSPSNTFKFWSYLFGIDHQFAEGVFGYVKTSRTQRSGGNQIRATTGDIRAFRPETITDYELGLKLDLLDRHVRFNVAAFYGDYKDIQSTQIINTRAPSDPANCLDTLTCTGATTTVVGNVGSAKVPGFEAELNVRFAGFSLDGGVSYVKLDYDNPDTRHSYTPNWQYNLAAGYETETGIGKLSGRLSYSWKGQVFKQESISKFNANPVGNAPLPSYGVLGARLTLATTQGFEISAYGNNLTKKRYYADALNVGGAFQVGYGFQPRTYGVEVAYAF